MPPIMTKPGNLIPLRPPPSVTLGNGLKTPIIDMDSGDGFSHTITVHPNVDGAGKTALSQITQATDNSTVAEYSDAIVDLATLEDADGKIEQTPPEKTPSTKKGLWKNIGTALLTHLAKLNNGGRLGFATQYGFFGEKTSPLWTKGKSKLGRFFLAIRASVYRFFHVLGHEQKMVKFYELPKRHPAEANPVQTIGDLKRRAVEKGYIGADALYLGSQQYSGDTIGIHVGGEHSEQLQTGHLVFEQTDDASHFSRFHHHHEGWIDLIDRKNKGKFSFEKAVSHAVEQGGLFLHHSYGKDVPVKVSLLPVLSLGQAPAWMIINRHQYLPILNDVSGTISAGPITTHFIFTGSKLFIQPMIGHDDVAIDPDENTAQADNVRSFSRK